MKLTVGIDEVGRGPIAGPVAVASFVFLSTIDWSEIALPLRDSKKLSLKQREAWFGKIEDWRERGKCRYCVSMVPAETIDTIGIVPSITRALREALSGLQLDPANTSVLLDGGLSAPKEYIYQKTIIRGDETERVIALASIVAKVHRDRHMHTVGEQYPEYGFESHVGYGTKKHYAAIRAHGLLPIHRKSFLKNLSV